MDSWTSVYVESNRSQHAHSCAWVPTRTIQTCLNLRIDGGGLSPLGTRPQGSRRQTENGGGGCAARVGKHAKADSVADPRRPSDAELTRLAKAMSDDMSSVTRSTPTRHPAPMTQYSKEKNDLRLKSKKSSKTSSSPFEWVSSTSRAAAIHQSARPIITPIREAIRSSFPMAPWSAPAYWPMSCCTNPRTPSEMSRWLPLESTSTKAQQ